MNKMFVMCCLRKIALVLCSELYKKRLVRVRKKLNKCKDLELISNST